ncbi:MAG: pantoate--beta-alanine ligase [Proteobacteria bacterium]|nr:pantoate--beta-alanine ligase [Pseudomonadota bacterium]
MQILTSTAELREVLALQRLGGRSIGLVPTMGNLHSGHLKLVDSAVKQCDFVVSTIFVNPLQFGPNEDLEAYPRSLRDDQEKLISAACSCLFVPAEEELFGPERKDTTIISVPEMSEIYCGKSRPGHFDGVATIVCKLFNIVQPDKAFFGYKDYQQLLLIRRMTQDLSFDIEIVGIETARNASGLALSSRNSYLDREELATAAMLYHCLASAADAIINGSRDYLKLEKTATQKLSDAGFVVDYFSICNAENLVAASHQDRSLVILAAAILGSCRLIDNVQLQVDVQSIERQVN